MRSPMRQPGECDEVQARRAAHAAADQPGQLELSYASQSLQIFAVKKTPPRRRECSGPGAPSPQLFLARNSVLELILSIETIADIRRSSFPKSFGQTEHVTGGTRLVTLVNVNRNRNRP